MTIRGLTIITIALGLALPSVPAQQTIPKAHGTTLSGTPVNLPDALNGKVGVIVVGFSHASGKQVSAWGRRLAVDYGQSTGVVYFEVAMLAGAPKMVRGMIVRNMNSSAPAAERPHFLPLMEDEAAWRAVAHYSKPDDAYVLLVDSTGTVRWQSQGDATDAAYSALKKNLESQTASAGAQ